MSRRPFDAKEDEKIVSLRAHGHSPRQIGAATGRNKCSIWFRLDLLNAATIEDAKARLPEIAKIASPPIAPVIITTAAGAKAFHFELMQGPSDVTAVVLGDPAPGRSEFDKLKIPQRVSLAKVGRTR